MSSKLELQSVQADLPSVPLTIEGAAVLHQMMRFRWAEWRKLAQAEKEVVLREAVLTLGAMEQSGTTALYSIIGHKGDLQFIHFRNSFDELSAAQLRLNNLQLEEFLSPTSSYVSVIELGLYESTVKLYRALLERGVAPHSEEWSREVEALLDRQRQAMHPRLFPKIPDKRYACFYPMDRKRGQEKNWYTLPIQERQRQMDEHGTVGRRYAGRVQQIISGSIGLDDWEWGVNLFADDPVIFKKLIYEMRFDEVSGVYSNFGAFYVGVRCPAAQLPRLLNGEAV